MNVEQAIERFREASAVGCVNNARTGGGVKLSSSAESAVISTVSSAFRFAAGTVDLSRIDYGTYADLLGDYALADAVAHGLADGSNRSARCRRFVRTVDGISYSKARPRTQLPLPEPWRELGEGLAAASLSQKARNYRHSRLVKLAVTVGLFGIRTPHELPDRASLRKMLTDNAGLKVCEANRLIWAYREARKASPAGRFPDVRTSAAAHQRGLRSLPDIVDRLLVAGCSAPLNTVDTEEILRLLAPTWHGTLVAYFQSARGRRTSARSRRRMVNASSRFLAEHQRRGLGDLRTAHPTRFLLEQIDTGKVLVPHAPGADEWARGLPGVSLSEITGAAQAETEKVSLLASLAASSTEASCRNSAVHPTDGGDTTFWTDSVEIDVQLVGSLGLFAGEGPVFQRHPELEQRARSELTTLKRRIREEKNARSFGGRKGKEALLDLATYPMILFIGLPALRRHAIHRLRQMQTALVRHPNESDHPSIIKAEGDYHDALLRYAVLGFFYTDGLRLANYAHARLGAATRDSAMVTKVSPCGTEVRSYTHVRPNLVHDELVGVATNFFGDDHPHVKLKIDKVPGSKAWRTRPHWIRPGLLDLALIRDYMLLARPRNLARQGLIDSPTSYDLQRDLEDDHFAMFVSPAKSTDPYRAVTGAYSPTALAAIFGRALHWIMTHSLGRTHLPPFRSRELRAKYPRLFAPHVARLQIGSYLYGILDRSAEAQTLLNDTATTVAKSYTVVEATMVHKTGWEAPRFFDALFRRAWDEHEVLDWDVVDPLAGLSSEEQPRGLEAVS